MPMISPEANVLARRGRGWDRADPCVACMHAGWLRTFGSFAIGRDSQAGWHQDKQQCTLQLQNRNARPRDEQRYLGRRGCPLATAGHFSRWYVGLMHCMPILARLRGPADVSAAAHLEQPIPGSGGAPAHRGRMPPSSFAPPNKS